MDDVLAWLDPRLEGVPPALAAAVRDCVRRSATDVAAEGAPEADEGRPDGVPDRLARAAIEEIERVVDGDGGPTGRDAALRLLAADASLTYAFEAAADLGDDLLALSDRVGLRGRIGRELRERVGAADADGPGLADLHCHFVPGVDDGAQTLESALDYLAAERERGVTRIATTPHLPASRAESVFRREVESRFDALRDAVDRRIPDLELSLAYEIRLDGGSIDPDDVGLWLGAGRHVLVEYDFFRLPEDPLAPLLPLLEAGLTPVLAHPERYHGAGRDDFWIDAVRGRGVKLCLNVGSCVGTHGPDPLRIAREMLTSGRADLVASDHHARAGRDDSVADVFDRLTDAGAGDAARALAADNPLVALDGGRMRAVPPVPEDALDAVERLHPAGRAE